MKDANHKVIVVYHGGRFTDRSDIWPLTHFGSEKAAIERIDVRVNEMHDKMGSKPTLYHCLLKLNDKVVEIPDWNAAYASGLLHALNRAGLLEISLKDLVADTQTLNALEKKDEREARRQVHAMIAHLKIDVIAYRNGHEDEGQMSYCVVNTDCVTVLGSSPFDMNKVASN